MDIGFYIADLLRNQDEVNLPGFGTFSKKKVKGYYDPAVNSFNPPSYTIDFSNNYSESPILEEYICYRKNLSASSADYFIKKFTSGISELLENFGTAELEPLGVIRQEKNNLIFEPSGILNLGGKFYGLNPVADLTEPITPAKNEPAFPAFDDPLGSGSIDPVVATVGDSVTPKENDPVVATVSDPGIPAENNPLVATVSDPGIPADSDPVIPAERQASIEDFINSQTADELFKEEKEKIIEEAPRRNRVLLIILGLLLFSILAAAALYLYNPRIQNLVDIYISKTSTTVPPNIDSANVSRPVPLAIPDSSESASLQIKVDSSATDISRPAKTEIKLPEPIVETKTIEIIGAAFGKRSEADRYVMEMNKKGLKARILEDMPGTLIKVSLASFGDFESAEQEFIRIRQNIEPNAWTTLYKSKKTQ